MTGFITRMTSTLMAVGLTVLALLASPVYANPFGGRHAPEGNRPAGGRNPSYAPYQPAQPYAPAPQRDAQRPDLQRPDLQRLNERRYEGREDLRQQRFSPEERRQLRRDIKDAGREIYPPRR